MCAQTQNSEISSPNFCIFKGNFSNRWNSPTGYNLGAKCKVDTYPWNSFEKIFIFSVDLESRWNSSRVLKVSKFDRRWSWKSWNFIFQYCRDCCVKIVFIRCQNYKKICSCFCNVSRHWSWCEYWWLCCSVVAEGSQDCEADVVPGVGERACVWYWYDWLRWCAILLLVCNSLMLLNSILTSYTFCWLFHFLFA